MKSFLLTVLVSCAFLAQAQYLVPQVFNPPVTGFQLLRDQNPYMLIQDSNNTTALTWVNSTRFLRKPYPLMTGFYSEDHSATWTNNTWVDEQTILDSFTLDNQNRFKTVIENNTLNIPGYYNKRKNKYMYTYDGNNKLIRIDEQTANPPASNNFTNEWYLKILYDQNGKRIIDSMFYYAFNGWYITSYHYDSLGNDVNEISMDGTDSSGITQNTFDGNRVKTSFTQTYDNSTGLWSPRQSDTFYYNTEQLISGHIVYSLSSVNGSNFFYQPIANENYHYTGTKKLDWIIYKTMDTTNTWINDSKFVISYDQNDHANLGYSYHSNNANGWNSYASQRIIFGQTNGVKEMYLPLSLHIYPNPAKDLLTISDTKQSLKESQIMISDMLGRTILESTVLNDGNEYSLSVSDLKTGAYILTIQTSEGIKRMKFLKE